MSHYAGVARNEAVKLLALDSRHDGPWVPVRRLRKIEVRGASNDDIIRVHFAEHDLHTNPEPLLLKGSVVRHINLPSGQVKVERVAGKAPVTILAICERLHGNGTETTT